MWRHREPRCRRPWRPFTARTLQWTPGRCASPGHPVGAPSLCGWPAGPAKPANASKILCAARTPRPPWPVARARHRAPRRQQNHTLTWAEKGHERKCRQRQAARGWCRSSCGGGPLPMPTMGDGPLGQAASPSPCQFMEPGGVDATREGPRDRQHGAAGRSRGSLDLVKAQGGGGCPDLCLARWVGRWGGTGVAADSAAGAGAVCVSIMEVCEPRRRPSLLGAGGPSPAENATGVSARGGDRRVALAGVAWDGARLGRVVRPPPWMAVPFLVSPRAAPMHTVTPAALRGLGACGPPCRLVPGPIALEAASVRFALMHGVLDAITDSLPEHRELQTRRPVCRALRL